MSGNVPRAIPPDAFVFIIGAMKSGTSSLFKYLQAHPEICAARIKEPEFFSESRPHKQNLARYEDIWDYDPRTHKYVLEASTGYTAYPMEQNVPENIVKYGIRPKFIYLMRDPFERIESDMRFRAIFMHEKLR